MSLTKVGKEYEAQESPKLFTGARLLFDPPERRKYILYIYL